MAFAGIPKVLSKMENPTIQPDEFEAQLKKLKKGKAPRPDSIKPELFMHLVKNPNLINKLTLILNIISRQNFPNQWKDSNTNLIPKID